MNIISLGLLKESLIVILRLYYQEIIPVIYSVNNLDFEIMKKNYLLVIILLTYLVSPVKSQTNTADIWIQDTYSVDSFSIEYRLFVPANYDSLVQYPIIYVFGGINYGDGNYFANADNTVPGISFADSLNQKNNPCFILMPGLPGGATLWWDPIVEIPLLGLINSTEKKYSIDQNRLYITGFSLGGHETFLGLNFYKGKFAAAITMSSGYFFPDSVKVFKDVPVWNFHGQKDGIVNVKGSRILMENYEKLQSKVIYTNSKYRQEINLSDEQIKNHILSHSNPFYTEYPEGGHDVWTESYNTPTLQQWLFSKYKLKTGAIELSNLNDSNVYPVLNDSYTILWNSENSTDRVEIWFSHNGGDEWELIQSKINDGSFDWDVSKKQDCSLGKIRILLKNSLGFVYGIDESALFAINNNASNGTPVIKILTQDFNEKANIALDSINLQLLIADPEKDSVTINLFVSYDNGINYESFDSFKKSTQIDTVYRMVYLNELQNATKTLLKLVISDNVSMSADSTLHFNNIRGQKPGSVERDNESAEINIYPNPFNDELSVQTKGNREYSVELITISGSTIYQSKIKGDFHRINLRELSSGIYFVRVQSEDFISVRKVLKE